MRTSLAKLRVAVDPNLIDFVAAVCRNNARMSLAAAPITDSSTGVSAAGLAPVLTQTARAGQSGSNLASRAEFNTALGSINNAVAVFAAFLNTNVFSKLDSPQLSGATGTVATQWTIPALTKSVGGVDGSAGGAMLRAEMNAAITRARNNLSMVVKAYNHAATAIGVATINDTSGGSASQSFAFAGATTAVTAVAANAVAASDLATKAAADAVLNAMANNVATIANRINTSLLAAATLNARVPVTLMP